MDRRFDWPYDTDPGCLIDEQYDDEGGDEDDYDEGFDTEGYDEW